MKKIAIFSLTKNRLDYTKLCLSALRKHTKLKYDHFIIDQASDDRTVEYLQNSKHLPNLKIYPLRKNIGINRGVNFALDRIGKNYDVIGKLDNDCKVQTKGWLKKIIDVLDKKEILSPYVLGLRDNRGGVNRIEFDKERNIGFTSFIGGICMVAYRKAWEDANGWEFPVPLHAGGDRNFCQRLSLEGYRFGYKEDVIIYHIDNTEGQENKYKDYFKLQKQEKTTIL